MPLEKKYVIVAVRLESKELVSIELLDESSAPPTVKTAIFRLGIDDFQALGLPTVTTKGEKLKVTIEVEKPPIASLVPKPP